MIITQPLLPEHWPAVKKIYEEGIATGHATFQTESPPWQDWDSSHLPDCRFIATNNSVILGWAALTKVSSRCVYAGVAELSVYVSASARGKKVGSLLMEAIIAASEASGFWTLQSGIFPENKASIALHQKYGFRIVGIREKIGQLNKVWRDNLLLERRSNSI